MSDTQQQVMLKVNFEDPKIGPSALFANHVGISRAGTEVQFEFVFLDINLVANTLQTYKGDPAVAALPVEISGKTVAKVVMPLHVFIQLRGHLEMLFGQIARDLQIVQEEDPRNEPSRVTNV